VSNRAGAAGAQAQQTQLLAAASAARLELLFPLGTTALGPGLGEG
jgi:hypothetical protein